MSNETKIEILLQMLNNNNIKYNLYGTYINEYELVIHFPNECVEIDFHDSDEVIDYNIDYVIDKITK